MENVELRFINDSIGRCFLVSVDPIKMDKGALYFDSDQTMWLMDHEKALAVIDGYADRCMSEMIGKSEYIIIYPCDSLVRIDGEKYIIGECLIMKSDHGLQCLSPKEIHDAFIEAISRITYVRAGQVTLAAYEI